MPKVAVATIATGINSATNIKLLRGSFKVPPERSHYTTKPDRYNSPACLLKISTKFYLKNTNPNFLLPVILFKPTAVR